jgi:hypothetical protein
MIAAVCFLIFVFLTLRSLILGLAERKAAWLKIIDIIFALLFASCAALLWVYVHPAFDRWSLAIAAAVIAIALVLLMRRLRRPYRFQPAALFLKLIFIAALVFGTLIVLMTAGFLNLFEDQPVLKVSMSGRYQMQTVEWKDPEGSLQKRGLPAYEVILEEPDGRSYARSYVYGDQVAIKARVMRLRPFLNLLGVHNFCRIDYIYTGYTTVERFNSLPHLAQSVPARYPALRPFQDVFWQFWEREFYQQKRFLLLKSATMESTYFPLVKPDGMPFRGSYFLTMTAGGLSSVPTR